MFSSPKPKVLRDLKSSKLYNHGGVFSSLPKRVNLVNSRKKRISLVYPAKVFFVLFAISSFILGSVTAPTTTTLAANPTDASERDALEKELAELEKQIDQYEDQVSTYQKQGKTLGSEVKGLDSKISKLSLQIKAIKLNLSQLDKKINETESQISVTKDNLDANRNTLGGILRDMYQSERVSMMEVFLKSPKISDFFDDVNDLALLQNSLQQAIKKIADLQEDLENQKEQLSLARADQTTLSKFQEAQRNETEKAKVQKNELLSVTKNQESKYQTLLKETKKSAAEIRSRIFTLLGGGELSFEKAYEFAKFAGSSTGVDPAFLLAILDRESALGKNVGKCSYKTAMHPKRDIPPFLEILKELKIDPDAPSTVVSCANSDGAYGGAMGPAQFIPSTWMLYKDAISKITGNSPASPWNNSDAFVATALYIKDSLSQCSVSYTNQTSKERCAAARYYAGGNWKRHLWTYGEATIVRANKFRDDIETITS